MNNLTKDVLLSIGSVVTCTIALQCMGVPTLIAGALVLPVAGYLGKQLAYATIHDQDTGIE